MIQKIPCARSEKDITRVSGTLSPSSILGGRTTLIYKVNLANLESSKIEGVAHKVAQNPSIPEHFSLLLHTLFPRLRWEKEVRLVGEQPVLIVSAHDNF